MFSLQNASAAEWVYVRPELGLGFSDNVYQDDFYKKSDAFTWLQTTAKYNLDESSLTGSLNLKMYSKEDSNNSASYSLNHTSETDHKDLDLTLGLGGFNYFKSDIGSTDEAFTHFYLTAYVTKKYQVNPDFDVNLEPGVKGSSYPQLANRYDLTAFLRIDSAWRLNEDIAINPYFELGLVASNRGYYSKSYMDLGVEYVQKLDELYKFNLDLYLRNNSYPNRRVSEILTVPNRAGRMTSTSIDSNEAISLSQITASVTRTELNHEMSIGISHSNENSLSQLEHYKEVQVLASTAWTF
jgi:hypothetical protein